jgi:hypothetical protein
MSSLSNTDIPAYEVIIIPPSPTDNPYHHLYSSPPHPTFTSLSRTDLLQACFDLRVAVFHHEQHFPLETEFDECASLPLSHLSNH